MWILELPYYIFHKRTTELLLKFELHKILYRKKMRSKLYLHQNESRGFISYLKASLQERNQYAGF